MRSSSSMTVRLFERVMTCTSCPWRAAWTVQFQPTPPSDPVFGTHAYAPMRTFTDRSVPSEQPTARRPGVGAVVACSHPRSLTRARRCTGEPMTPLRLLTRGTLELDPETGALTLLSRDTRASFAASLALPMVRARRIAYLSCRLPPVGLTVRLQPGSGRCSTSSLTTVASP